MQTTVQCDYAWFYDTLVILMYSKYHSRSSKDQLEFWPEETDLSIPLPRISQYNFKDAFLQINHIMQVKILLIIKVKAFIITSAEGHSY